MKYITTTLLLCALLFTSCSQNSAPKGSQVELKFNYVPQSIYASNQYAVWVEDAQGKLVKTLQVTSCTTKGRSHNDEPLIRGYIKRPLSIPTWVRRARPDDLSDDQLDAITIATPVDGGMQQVVWDFTDQEGKPVAAGEYSMVLEATLFQESTVTYRAVFSTDDLGEIAVERTITQNNDEREGMIEQVSVRIE